MSFLKSVPDRLLLGLVFVILFFINFKYVMLLVEIPYTLRFSNFVERNSFYKKMHPVEQERELFKNEKYVGFVTDIKSDEVFLHEETVKNFYIAQYAVVPSILVTELPKHYVVGIFDKVPIARDMKVYKKLTDKIFIYKCTVCGGHKTSEGMR